MVTTDKVTVTEFAPHIGKTTTDYIVDIWNYKKNDMRVKVYESKDGMRMFFHYDENGIGKITVEAMDLLMEMIGAKEVVDDSNT